MDKYESLLFFKKYVINEILFKSNEKFVKPEDKKIDIDFTIKKHIENNDNNLIVRLIVNIFEDSIEKNYPFEMQVILTGYFEINGDGDVDFEPNAIAILYPYIRSLVSTYTANANIPPLLLPTINVNKVIEESKKDKE